ALQLLKRLQQARGGLSNRRCKYLRSWMLLEGLLQYCRVQRLAQFGHQVDYLRPGALGDLHDLAAEETQAARDKRIAVFEQVAQHGLSAGEAGAGDAQRHRVFRLEYQAQQPGRFFEHAEKLRIDVPELRCRGDTQHAWINVARTRAE